VHHGAEVGEGGGAEVVGVIGEQALGLLVTLHWRHAGRGKGRGGVAGGTAEDREGVRALLVDVGLEQGLESRDRFCAGARRGNVGRLAQVRCGRRARPIVPATRDDAFDPTGERAADRVEQSAGVGRQRRGVGGIVDRVGGGLHSHHACPMAIDRVEPGPGQESVWDYPRPPRTERTNRHLVVSAAGVLIADTQRAHRVLETSQPPAYYFDPADVRVDHLRPSTHTTLCEWKGLASYYDVVVGDAVVTNAAWTYLNPAPQFAEIRDHLAFYAQALDCSVDGEAVVGNEGTFYGGWITSHVVGPFKGGVGTAHW